MRMSSKSNNQQKRNVLLTRPRPISISHSYTSSSIPSSPQSFSPNLTTASTQSSFTIVNNEHSNNITRNIPSTIPPPLTSLSLNIVPSLPRLSQGLPSLLSSPSLSSPSSTSSSSSPLWMNKPPRTNWNISDKQLKPIPPFHPPIPPTNVIHIHDSSPSIVACRISSCLRKRSIITNFDDDTAVATCWSKGDNGGGEGELLLFSGAASNYNRSSSTSSNIDQVFNQKDYGSSANDLAGSYYGGGGGCVVFSIHLYRGTKRGGDVIRNNGNYNYSHDGHMSSMIIQQHSQNHNQNQSYNQGSRFDMDNHRHDKHNNNSDSEGEYPFQELYNSKRSHKTKNMSSVKTTTDPDFSNVVIVECMRIRGDTIHFHKDCKAIFASARGDSDGLDDYRSPRSMLYHSPLVFKRMRTIPSLPRNNHQIFDSYDGYDNHEIDDDDDDYDNERRLKDNPNLLNLTSIKMKKSPSDLTKSTFTALERVLDLLEKDRFDAQLLGVKSLTFLTDPSSSGFKCSYLTSLCILGSQQRFGTSRPNNGSSGVKRDRGVISNVSVIADRLHHRVVNIAMGNFDKVSSVVTNNNIHNTNNNPNQNNDDPNNNQEQYNTDYPFHTLVKSMSNNGIISCTDTNNFKNNPNNSKKVNIIESQYMSTIRGYMIHALTNAFTNLIQNNDQFPLLTKPTCTIPFMTKEFINKICGDVDGASRPPMALLGTAHEATHAIRLLHLIASYSEEGFHTVHGTLVGNNNGVMCGNGNDGNHNSNHNSNRVIKKRPILELFDKAYDAGVASHHVLRLEARVARNMLSGRSSKDCEF